MTEVTASRRDHRAPERRTSTTTWVIRWVLVGIAAALLFLVGWVGIRGLIAKSELESALPLVSDLKDDLKAVDLSSAQGTVAVVASRTANAKALTSDPIWRAMEIIPGAGPNLAGFRELADVTDDIAQGVMVPVAGLADTLDPAALKPVDGRIDVGLFTAAAPVVSGARASLETAYEDIQAIDTSGAIGQIQDAHRQLEGMLGPMLPLVEQADEIVGMLPTMLGADGPRSYLVVFQNNSESRSLGGHAGSWVQVNVDDGAIELARQATVSELKTGGVPVIHLSADQLALWPGAGSDPSNVTMVPNLGLSAQTASAFWATKFSTQPSAVFFIDPVALGYVLAAIGPVELPTGDVINSENAATFLLNGVYLKYPDPAQQDAVFGAISKSVFGAMLGGSFDPKKLVDAALAGGKEHRVLAWFFSDEEREALRSLPFSLEEPVNDDERTTFGLYINDNLGSKMTYYVDGKVALGQAQCAAGGVEYRVLMELSNIVTPAEGPLLPTYVANQAQGSLRVLVTLYAPLGSTYVRSEGWDPDFTPIVRQEGNYLAIEERLVLDPSQTKPVNFILKGPDDNADRELTAYVTPLARPIPVEETPEFTC
ncbi:DUF4012 domain-containing protein [Antiquaquibacter soli]|uniref:DUF4012 domain-containing protein n=1 Tax=Antiquaquibacter soli TaxID=3064523 RepID=A0ABT9BJ25_9MICO|nr:DUF4012 domain-containing protein [Protaetiibacter sp. WY-16]MDO7881030.1 DUF4012 domain-containing protein [Protaetiibacter sp. WY-16]